MSIKAVTNLECMVKNVVTYVLPIARRIRVTSRMEHVMYTNMDGLGQRVTQVILVY